MAVYNLTNVRIPLTNIQTPLTTTIRFVVPTGRVTVASTSSLYGQKGSGALFRSVGAANGIVSFSKDESRSVEKLYGFNGNEMEPFMVVPGAQNITLTLRRIVFYKEDFFEQLGFLRGSLLYQENPFIIVEEQYKLIQYQNPFYKKEQEETEEHIRQIVHARSIFYFDCWIVNNPIQYDISTKDLILIPEFKVEVGKIVSTEDVDVTLFKTLLNVMTDIGKSKANNLAINNIKL